MEIKINLQNKKVKLTTIIGTGVIIILLFLHILAIFYLALQMNECRPLTLLQGFIFAIYFWIGAIASIFLGTSIIELGDKKNNGD